MEDLTMATQGTHETECLYQFHRDETCTCSRFCAICGTDQWSTDPHEDDCPKGDRT